MVQYQLEQLRELQTELIHLDILIHLNKMFVYLMKRITMIFKTFHCNECEHLDFARGCSAYLLLFRMKYSLIWCSSNSRQISGSFKRLFVRVIEQHTILDKSGLCFDQCLDTSSSSDFDPPLATLSFPGFSIEKKFQILASFGHKDPQDRFGKDSQKEPRLEYPR